MSTFTLCGLALRSVRFRGGTFAASFLSVFLGATIVMAFASLLDTAAGAGVDATTEETLTTMASVVGGWGLVLVVFAVASTHTMSVRQRAGELAVLRTVGATPGQVRTMIVAEAAVVGLVGAAAAIAPAVLAGRELLSVLKDTEQAAPTVAYHFGPAALGVGIGVTVLASVVAAAVTARRAARMRTQDAMFAAAVESPRLGRKRVVAASRFLVAGLNCAVVTATVFDGKGYDAMQTAGQASIWFAVGLALFAPALVRAVVRVLAVPLFGLGGSGGYLTVWNVRRRSHAMAGAVMPVILFTAIATGTIYMQVIENAATTAAGASKTEEQRTIETLNFVVVGMIALFAALMLVNTVVAATAYRRREFGQQRLVGSTPPQVLGMVGLESLVLVVTGVLFGSVASLVTVLPYNHARTGTWLPDTTVAIYLAVVGVAAALTLAASLGSAKLAVRVPAVQAAA